MNKLRIIGLVLFGVLAVGIGLGSSGEVRDYSSDISGSISMAEINEDSARGAPQQTVVNGWVARDLLEIIAKQGNEGQADQRVPLLLMTGVLAFIWNALLSPRAPGASAAGPAPAGVPTQPAAPSALPTA